MANPVEEHRRAQRKKELKKNKQTRLKQHNESLIQGGNLSEIQKEIRKLEARPKASLDAASVKKLERLQKDYKVLLEHHRSNKPASSGVVVQKSIRSRELAFPQMSIYYDERLNPFGAPPPGRPMLYHCEQGPTQNYDAALQFAIKMGWAPSDAAPASSKPVIEGPTSGSTEESESNNSNFNEKHIKVNHDDSPSLSSGHLLPKKDKQIPQSASVSEHKLKEQVYESSDPPPPSEAVLRVQRQLKGKGLNNKHVLAVDIWGSTAEESVCYGNEDEEERAQQEQQRIHLEKLNQRQQRAKMKFGKRKASNEDPVDNIMDPTASGYTDYRAIPEKNGSHSRQAIPETKKPKRQLVDEWFYKDNGNGDIQGPFTTNQMIAWYDAGFFPPSTPVRNGSESNAVFKPLSNVNFNNVLQSLQCDLNDDVEAEDDSIQARIAALKNDDKSDDMDKGVQDRIAALKRGDINEASPDQSDKEDNLNPYPVPVDSEADLVPYPSLDDDVVQYPPFEDENDTMQYPVTTEDDAYATYGTENDVSYSAYPLADNETEYGSYPVPESQISESVIAPYPNETNNMPTSIERCDKESTVQLKKFEGDRAVVGFVPSHLNKAKRSKATKIGNRNITTKREIEPNSKMKNMKNNSVANDYEAFMSDIAKL